jgi:nucleoside-diphosphate-sugar epimerase
MNSLFHVLNLAKAKKIKKIFWPSSIAVFGPQHQKKIPQYTSWSRPRYTESASNLVKDGVILP